MSRPNRSYTTQDPPSETDDTVTLVKDISEQLAANIRRCWIKSYSAYISRQTQRKFTYRPSPQWDGGTDSFGKVHKPFWPKVAKFVLQHKLNYIDLVRSQFSDRSGKSPLPTILISNLGLELYKEYRANIENKLQVELATQNVTWEVAIQTAKLMYNGDDANISVLYNPNLELSALFRYCKATQLNLQQVKNDWREAAISQFMLEPQHYMQAWNSFIPNELITLTTNIFKSV